jgi:hypothetical protein
MFRSYDHLQVEIYTMASNFYLGPYRGPLKTKAGYVFLNRASSSTRARSDYCCRLPSASFVEWPAFLSGRLIIWRGPQYPLDRRQLDIGISVEREHIFHRQESNSGDLIPGSVTIRIYYYYYYYYYIYIYKMRENGTDPSKA